MKIPWLCGFVVMCTSAALAQTGAASSPQPPGMPAGSAAPAAVAMTGCVARGSKSEPVTLTHAMVVPSGAAAGDVELPPSMRPATVTPQPAPVSGVTTQPQTSAQPPPAADAIPAAVGTSGTIAGTAPAGSSASSVDGYRLSGVDMSSWIGRRVQVMGVVAPSAAPPRAGAVETGKRPASASMREFRVLSVQPVTGPCTK